MGPQFLLDMDFASLRSQNIHQREIFTVSAANYTLAAGINLASKMAMENSRIKPQNRLGFHYYPDTHHYRESDLRAWLPELKSLGASWLVLRAPTDRAIPESFLAGLVSAEVEPILHFPFSLTDTPLPEDLSLIFETYARWGIRYVILFDRPNRRRAWSPRDWAQQQLVERFIDRFLPIAEVAVGAGLTPVFPPLEPGGDYWDTAFLRTAMLAIKRRSPRSLLKKLTLSAYAWPGNRPISWGAGGPERWPGARPYHTPPGEEDQRGFRIFEWYLTISRAVLGEKLPIILLGTGCQLGAHGDPTLPAVDEETHTERNLALIRALSGQVQVEAKGDPAAAIPTEVVAGNFWLLASEPDHGAAKTAWFQTDGSSLPIVGALKQWRETISAETADIRPSQKTIEPEGLLRPIAHYLLLPSYDWGIADWHLEVIKPFIKNHKPTIGFSLVEAAQSTRVTLLGGPQEFSEDILEDLRTAGCIVERIDGDGTSIATVMENH